MIGVGAYLAKLWWDDRRDFMAGHPSRQPLPGAAPSSVRACVIAGIGGVVIVIGETAGEIHLGLTAEQSSITVLFGLYTLAAAVIEEIIFRGYLIIEDRGPRLQWLGVAAATVVFALIHPFLWSWDDGFALTLTAKGWFSTAAVAVSSVWFYTVRLAKWNPTRSLLPCFIAHGAHNLAVFGIKGTQGFVHGWW